MCYVDNVPCLSLVDTGSQISTVSEGFREEYLDGCPIRELDDILKIEGAGGQDVPILGYIEADISFPEQTCGSQRRVPTLLLVVRDTSFNKQVPIVIGTNVIRKCREDCIENFGSCFMQKVKPDLAWRSAYQYLSHVRRKYHKIFKSTKLKTQSSAPVVVHPNETIVLWSAVQTRKIGGMVTALMESSDSVPAALQVVPAVVNVKMDGSKTYMPIKLHNGSTGKVTLVPGTALCSLQQVSIVDSMDAAENSEALSQPSSSVVDFDDARMDQEQKIAARETLERWNHIFAQGPNDLGCTASVKHRIRLQDEIPFKQRHRRIPPSQYDEVRQHLKDMLDSGVIRESHSPYSSPVVLVRKRDGSLRFCIDFRKLNSKTVKDAYALPRMEEALEAMAGCSWFSTLDLKSGYWQVEIDEPDKAKTAFTVGPLGFFECNRMAFGLTNAPATFQRLMEHCMADINFKKCIVYIDDIIVYSRSFDEHLERLEAVFARLEQYGLKLKPSKCSFFKEKVKYLGHIISVDGIETDPEKVSAIRDWPVPENLGQLRTFLGFCGYYRRFVPAFSKLVKPLNDLVTSLLGKPGQGKRQRGTEDWKWSDDCQSAFDGVVKILSSPVVLTYPDFKLPFIVNTDASQDGLGATLSQEQDGVEKVICYASRALRKAEKNYPAHKLEFLALKWAVVDKFHDYLYGHRFTVRTDNNPLTYVTTTARLDATGHRWLASLATYDFDIIYRAGRKNQDADALSRRPHEVDDEEECTISREEMIAMSNGITTRDNTNQPVLIESFCMNEVGVDMAMGICAEAGTSDLPSLSIDELRLHQESDQILGRVIQLLKSKKMPRRADLMREERGVRDYLRQLDRLHLVNGVLYRECGESDQKLIQLVIPEALKLKVFQGIHENMGHFGVERTLALARSRFFWSGMAKELTQMVKTCKRCVLRRSPRPHRVAPLVPIVSSSPMELVCIDYLKLERSAGGYENVLVITDHFTRYAQAIPTLNQTAKTTARVLFDKFIVHYGFPERLHSDQGRNFESQIIRQLCSLAGVEKSRTTPYHPSGNGMCERFNRTLLHMLSTLPEKEKKSWKDAIAPMVHAYNATTHESTGFSPFYLMFGREPRLAIDVYLGLTPNNRTKAGSMSKFVADLKRRLRQAYDVAQTNSKVASKRQKNIYDRRPMVSSLRKGDRVLLRNLTPSGKLDNFWEEDMYVVISRPNNDLPVFEIQKENGQGRKRMIHRNHLLPCPFPPDSAPQDVSVVPDVPQENSIQIARRSGRVRNKPRWMKDFTT